MKVNIYLAIVCAALAYTGGLILGNHMGKESATFHIAYACVHDNTFDHDGYKFTCFDQDDYYAPPTKSLDSSAVTIPRASKRTSM